MIKVDNAIIMAAGTSSRFAPLSFETHKGLIEVRGEILVERQIRQLRESGINQIIIVTGYKAESFEYLKEKYGVILVHNPDFLTRNNNASIYAAKDYLKNSYLCSVDNYFVNNPFTSEVDDSYYAAQYSEGKTNEWCITEDEKGYIDKVVVGGSHSWYMMGHTFWSKEFSSKFIAILNDIYQNEQTKPLLWEDIYIKHLDVLKMKIKKYQPNDIFEFDTLDELRVFDETYIDDTRSKIIKRICSELDCKEKDIIRLKTIKNVNNAADGFEFECLNKKYRFSYSTQKLEIENE